MSKQKAPPEPFAFTHKDEFLAMPLEERPPHIWECLQYLEWREGVGDVPDQIDKNVRIVRHIAQDVAKAIARKLEEQGAYTDPLDPRWPRFHRDSSFPGVPQWSVEEGERLIAKLIPLPPDLSTFAPGPLGI